MSHFQCGIVDTHIPYIHQSKISAPSAVSLPTLSQHVQVTAITKIAPPHAPCDVVSSCEYYEQKFILHKGSLQ